MTAQGLTVKADILCDEGFEAFGTINLLSASIGGGLNLSGAHLDGKDGAALIAQGMTVTVDMFCAEGFRAKGTAEPT